MMFYFLLVNKKLMMQLKKINLSLLQALNENNFIEATLFQKDTYSIIKSGKDAVCVSSKGNGKTTAIALHAIQKLEKPFLESPRVIIICDSKENVLFLSNLIEILSKYNGLRVFKTYEKTNLDDDKNLISLGIDILIGTPEKLNNLFATAGFDVNQLQLLMIDDFDEIVKKRQDHYINRLLMSIPKTQFLFFSNKRIEKLDIFSEKYLKFPEYYEL